MAIPTVKDRREILQQGADIVAPALVPHGFHFSMVASGGSSGGAFAQGEFVRGDRKLELHFRWSLGLVTYHIGAQQLAHADYMRALLGRSQAGHYPLCSDDSLAGFEALRRIWSSIVQISSAALVSSFVSVLRSTGIMSHCRHYRRWSSE